MKKCFPFFWQMQTPNLFRSLFFQVFLCVVVFVLFREFYQNISTNMSNKGINLGISFFSSSAGFSVSQSLLSYSGSSSFARMLLIGFLNTVLIAFLGIFFATVAGFFLGVMRLSHNWLISKFALCYVETIRNIPLLMQIFIWYQVILSPLPAPRFAVQFGLPYPDFGFLILGGVILLGGGLLRACYRMTPSVVLRMLSCFAYLASCAMAIRLIFDTGLSIIHFTPMGIFLSNRGLFFPVFTIEHSFFLIVFFLTFAFVLSLVLYFWARRRQDLTGKTFPVFWVSVLMLFGIPGCAIYFWGDPVAFEYPQFKGFNFQGGGVMLPEFIALLAALSTYTAAFIAEIVRSGVQAVNRGQMEAASSLGIPRALALRKIILPQAMRVIIPPLASQYLNLTKNSSLAAAIGYPELVAIGGIVMSQSGHSVEVILVWMMVYLSLSLLTSLLMNLFNARMKLVER